MIHKSAAVEWSFPSLWVGSAAHSENNTDITYLNKEHGLVAREIMYKAWYVIASKPLQNQQDK